MAKEEITLQLKVDGGDNINKTLEETNKQLKDVSDSSGKMSKGFKSFGNAGKTAFKGIGTAIKTAGIGLLIGVFAALFEAMKQNQKVMDLFETAINAIGIVVKPLVDGISDLVTGLIDGSEEFDAIGEVMKNLMTTAINPLKLAFYSLQLGFFELKKGWLLVKDAFGGDVDTAALDDINKSIEETKNNIVDVAIETKNAAIDIVNNLGEAIDEVSDLGTKVISEVGNAVTAVANGSASAVTQAKKDLETLALEQDVIALKALKAAEDQRQIRDDETNSIKVRQQANEKLAEILEQQRLDEIGNVNKQIKAQQTLMALDPENQDNILKLTELKNKLLEIDERIGGQTSEQKANINSLANEEIAISNDAILRKENAAKAEIERKQGVNDELQKMDDDYQLKQITDDEARRVAEVELDYKRAQEDLERRLELGEITQEEYDEFEFNNLRNKNEKISEITDEFNKLLKDKEADKLRAMGQLAIEIGSMAADAVFNNKQQRLDDQKAAELSNTNLTEKEKEKINKKYAKKQKDLDIKKALINGALGITSALASVQPTFPAGVIAAAGVAVATGIQVAAIKNTAYRTGGIVNGNSHSNGGVNINAEGGEGMVNVRSMQNPLIAQEVLKLNNLGNAGAADSYKGNSGVDSTTIATAVITAIKSIPVTVTENQITTKQELVSVRESRFTQN